MGRYYFHLHDGHRLLEDHEGRECSSLEEANAYAIANARDVMIGEIHGGRLDLRWYILISGDPGEVLGRISFADAIRLVGP